MMRHSPLHGVELLALMIPLAMVWLGAGQACAHDRPTGPLHKGRSVVYSTHGLAATSQPLAAQAAIRILQEGGNAIDAAIGANAVIGVVEPMSCGIGGDLFAMVWDARTSRLHGLNASGRSPIRASIEEYREKAGGDLIPTYGPLSWTVPGCVDGWAQLHTRFGRKPWSGLFSWAIDYARNGFPVSEVIASSWQGSAASLKEIPSSAACYLPGGQAPATGEIFRNEDLARSLELIAEGGAEAFYKGTIARQIVRYSEEVGGYFSREDFERHSSTWVDPVSTNYRGYDVWELPPNGQGIAALQMLNLLEGFDLKSMGPNSVDALHLMIEAKKLAFEDRATYYADPEAMKVEVGRLISKEYARERAKLIDRTKASERPEPGVFPQSDTIYLVVADGEGNVVSLIQSLFHGFGSQHVAGRLGFALQNRGSQFSLDPAHPNHLAPGKRPFHTIIPGFVTKEDQPWLAFGVMGGDMQPQGHVQVLINMIDFGMDVQEAGEAPRFRHYGSSEPTGVRATDGGTVSVESGIDPSVREGLAARGHRVVVEPPGGGFGGYQGIRIDRARKVLMGGSDPRKDGAAIGY